jgi:hypothetical protein
LEARRQKKGALDDSADDEVATVAAAAAPFPAFPLNSSFAQRLAAKTATTDKNIKHL